MRQAHVELQRCSSVLGVNDLAHEYDFEAVPGTDVDRARMACFSALQDARDTGRNQYAALCSATL